MNEKQTEHYGFIELVISDAKRWNANPNIFNFLAMFFLQPGFQLAFSLRSQQAVSRIPLLGKLLRKIIWYITCISLGCHCSARSTYGKGLYFPHPCNIVIGDGVRIGNNVTIYQGVTLGVKDVLANKYSVVEDDVVLYSGSQIIGDVIIEKGAMIGANAVVLQNVPEGSIAVGIPARIVEKK